MQGRDRLVGVRRERSDIHERFHIWVASGRPRDHRTAIRVAENNDRSLLGVDETLCRHDVGIQAGERILNGNDRIVLLLEQRNQLLK